jgi:hypothetical protein
MPKLPRYGDVKCDRTRDRTPLAAALDYRGIGQRNGEDVLHPRLVRGRYLETEPHVNTGIFGQPSLFCYEHTSAGFSRGGVSTAPASS